MAMTIKNNFRRLLFEKSGREVRRLSYHTIQKETGLSISTIQLWMNEENIKRFDADTVERLCNYLECDLCDLLTIVNE